MIKEIGIIGDFHNSKTQSTIADYVPQVASNPDKPEPLITEFLKIVNN